MRRDFYQFLDIFGDKLEEENAVDIGNKLVDLWWVERPEKECEIY